MKIRPFFLAATLAAVGAFSGMAWAQDTGSGQGAGTGAGMRGRLNFLSEGDRAHLMRVRRQVMADNPDLKTEQASLMKEWQYVRGKGAAATADDKETLRNNFLAHNEKMNAAMVKADPSVQPILDQVKAHMKERFAQRAGDAGTASGAGNDSGNP